MAISDKEAAGSVLEPGRRIGFNLAREGEAAGRRPARSGRMVTLLSLQSADILAAQAAFYLGVEIHAALVLGDRGADGFGSHLALLALTLPAAYHLRGVYCVHRHGPIERFSLRMKATCLLFALLVGWHYVTAQSYWPTGAIALTFAFAIVLPLIGESLVRSILIRWGLWGVPTVVIGAGPIGQQVIRVLRNMPELGLRPVGVFENDSTGSETRSSSIHGVPVLGSIADAARYSSVIETAIVTTPVQTNEAVASVAADVSYRNIIVVPNLRDLPTLWVQARDLNGLIGLEVRRNLLLRRNRWLKQVMDSLLALPLAVIALPVIAILALWIRSVSRGSPFYAQLRAGKGESPISVWKLRTMYPDAEQRLEQHLNENPSARQEWHRCFKLTNDPRILPGVGHFLRRTSLDELPQLFNVIRGEMSLVGPRPFPKYHLDRFDRPFQSLRSSVVPGITGLWQISARSDGDLAVQQALDTYYIRNWSIWFDIFILSRTFGAVLAGRGAR